MNHTKFECFRNISKKNKAFIILDLLASILIVSMQIFLIKYYIGLFPVSIIMFNVIILIFYFLIILCLTNQIIKLEKTNFDLGQARLCNKNLQVLYDNISAFRHDFSNIIAGIGGYVETSDMDGLRQYYKQLSQDCQYVNNLSVLNPDSINSPAIYAIISNKYNIADSKGIKVHIECIINFKRLYMPIYEFSRILGILLDNAIEAAAVSEKKLINILIRDDTNNKKQILIVENSYSDKGIDINKIYEKGFTTKEKNSGLGLWEVNKIISKNKNLVRFTTKSEEFFKQQIEIYYK